MTSNTSRSVDETPAQQTWRHSIEAMLQEVSGRQPFRKHDPEAAVVQGVALHTATLVQ